MFFLIILYDINGMITGTIINYDYFIFIMSNSLI